MTAITVILRDGTMRQVEATAGMSVMEAIRDAGIDELLAMCGGCCSCATCHVHVAADYLAMLPPVGRDEDELLDASPTRDATSRLSCQIAMTARLDGLNIRIASED